MIFKELWPFISSEAAAQTDPRAGLSLQAHMVRATAAGELISCVGLVKGSPEPRLSLRAAAAGDSRNRSPLPFPL